MCYILIIKKYLSVFVLYKNILNMCSIFFAVVIEELKVLDTNEVYMVAIDLITAYLFVFMELAYS